MAEKPIFRVIVRARENGGYRYQILAVGSAAHALPKVTT
jgi:hypothetical protein